MAIGFRASSNSGASNVSAATVAITLPAGVQATDIVVVTFAYANTTKGSLGSWSPPSGWAAAAPAATPIANSTQDASEQSFWALGSVANLTFTRVGTVDFLGWTCAAFTGVDNTTPIDATGTDNGGTGSSALVVNAVTVVTDQAWELIGFTNNDGGATTATGFAVVANYVSRLLYNTTPKSVGSTGTVSVSVGGSSGNLKVARPFALRPAGSGSVSGSLTATLGALAATAAAQVAVAASATATLGALSGADAAAVAVAGQTSASLAPLVATAAGAVAVVGTLAATLGGLALTAAGAVAVAGSAASALGAMVVAAASQVPVVGQLLATLDSLGLSATGGSPQTPGRILDVPAAGRSLSVVAGGRLIRVPPGGRRVST